MPERTRPLSVRLPTSAVDQLRERAARLSGAPTSLARELILSGLAGGDAKALGERLMGIERKLAALGQDIDALANCAARQEAALDRLGSMFEALLAALSSEETHADDHHD